jgi:hypothetical protein
VNTNGDLIACCKLYPDGKAVTVDRSVRGRHRSHMLAPTYDLYRFEKFIIRTAWKSHRVDKLIAPTLFVSRRDVEVSVAGCRGCGVGPLICRWF